MLLPHPNRCAFTFIEIVVATAIMALLLSAAVLSFSGPLHRAKTAEAIEQVRYIDNATRDLARRFSRKMEIVIDLSESRIDRREIPSREITFTSYTPSPVRMEGVWTAAQFVDAGEVTIPLSSSAISPTYAVKFATPQGERWIVVAGFTGETTVCTDEAQVQAIFAKIAPRRDAD